jgi:diaminohydroxyphosphoribosylaminopyrimidine deaminase/5-amino-6-(5-phosphoribosylamino)uracil reductase
MGDASLTRPARSAPILEGSWDAADHLAFRLFSPLLRPGRLSVAQLGQSLDGRIATGSGDSYYINGQVMRAHLHRLRALADAVIVGAGTAATDRPALTVRHCPGTDPVPVIIDPQARVSFDGPLFDAQRTPRLILVHSDTVSIDRAPSHLECIPIPADRRESRLDLAPTRVLDALADRGLGRVLIEGGGVTVSRFIDGDALDRLHLLIAPLLIGSGPSGIDLQPIERLSQARRPVMQSYELGGELLVDVDMRSCA